MSTASTLAAAERLLSDMLVRYADSPLDARDMESDFQRFLQLIQSAPSHREHFATMFVDMLSGRRGSPEWLVAYCMRVLRWPEILQAADAEIRKRSPSTMSTARDVLTAYGDEWTGNEIFEIVS